MSDVTQVLDRVQQGDADAAEELLPLVYEELRKLAAHKMAHGAPGQTLQPTALVHEAWLRLIGSGDQHWSGRGHFFGAAAEAMRRILVENARRKGRVRHGGQVQRVDLTSGDWPAAHQLPISRTEPFIGSSNILESDCGEEGECEKRGLCHVSSAQSFE